MSVTGRVARSVRRAERGARQVPTPDELARNAMRHVAGAALVVLAAAIVHRSGHDDQQWQYVAVAAAFLPQVLLDVLAVRDTERRAQLRKSARMAPVPLLAAAVLAVGASTALLSGHSVAVGVAALAAAGGLALAAAPVTVSIAPRTSRGGAATRRRGLPG